MERILRWQSTQRYYVARLHQDLLGDWVVQRAWGGLGSRLGNTDTILVANLQMGNQALSDLHSRRTARRYQLVQDITLPPKPVATRKSS